MVKSYVINGHAILPTPEGENYEYRLHKVSSSFANIIKDLFNGPLILEYGEGAHLADTQSTIKRLKDLLDTGHTIFVREEIKDQIAQAFFALEEVMTIEYANNPVYFTRTNRFKAIEQIRTYEIVDIVHISPADEPKQTLSEEEKNNPL